MTPERRPGQPIEGQVPFGGGKNAPRPAEPQATHGPPEGQDTGDNPVLDKQRPPEAGRPPPEEQRSGQLVEIVDVLELEKRERRRHQNREAQRRWRQNHKEAHRAQVRTWYQKAEVMERKAAYQRSRRLKIKEQRELMESSPSPFTD